MDGIFIAIDVFLVGVLAWFFMQYIRLNRALKEKNAQLEAAPTMTRLWMSTSWVSATTRSPCRNW
jgi:hypothetical protein